MYSNHFLNENIEKKIAKNKNIAVICTASAITMQTLIKLYTHLTTIPYI